MNWTGKIIVLVEKMDRRHKNIRTISALENLLSNLDKIPVEQIEKLVKDNE